jgi:hypothetical protein
MRMRMHMHMNRGFDLFFVTNDDNVTEDFSDPHTSSYLQASGSNLAVASLIRSDKFQAPCGETQYSVLVPSGLRFNVVPSKREAAARAFARVDNCFYSQELRIKGTYVSQNVNFQLGAAVVQAGANVSQSFGGNDENDVAGNARAKSDGTLDGVDGRVDGSEADKIEVRRSSHGGAGLRPANSSARLGSAGMPDVSTVCVTFSGVHMLAHGQVIGSMTNFISNYFGGNNVAISRDDFYATRDEAGLKGWNFMARKLREESYRMQQPKRSETVMRLCMVDVNLHLPVHWNIHEPMQWDAPNRQAPCRAHTNQVLFEMRSTTDHADMAVSVSPILIESARQSPADDSKSHKHTHAGMPGKQDPGKDLHPDSFNPRAHQAGPGAASPSPAAIPSADITGRVQPAPDSNNVPDSRPVREPGNAARSGQLPSGNVRHAASGSNFGLASPTYFQAQQDSQDHRQGQGHGAGAGRHGQHASSRAQRSASARKANGGSGNRYAHYASASILGDATPPSSSFVLIDTVDYHSHSYYGPRPQGCSYRSQVRIHCGDVTGCASPALLADVAAWASVALRVPPPTYQRIHASELPGRVWKRQLDYATSDIRISRVDLQVRDERSVARLALETGVRVSKDNLVNSEYHHRMVCDVERMLFEAYIVRVDGHRDAQTVCLVAKANTSAHIVMDTKYSGAGCSYMYVAVPMPACQAQERFVHSAGAACAHACADMLANVRRNAHARTYSVCVPAVWPVSVTSCACRPSTCLHARLDAHMHTQQTTVCIRKYTSMPCTYMAYMHV